MSQPSKLVADRVSISRTVLGSLNEHTSEIATELEIALFPEGLPREITVASFLHALRDLLARSTETMFAADLAHARELADDDAPRALAEERVEGLKALLLSLRTTLASTYGVPVAAAYGIPSQIPDDPEVLLRVASTVERLLRERPLVEPPKIKSLAIAPLAVAEDLGLAIADLRRALVDVDRERREAILSQSTKNLAMARWLSTYQGVTEAACGLYALAGQAALAEGIRPTARRLAGLPEEEDAAPSTERSR
ncbi:hypothetical protein [Polyangium jinanense]|uniref:Uncharacterized protein n=1 Tax=Polyangium jinanense TaxID=2829994 RepID=A0A9X3X7U5_9BACT|nr:hypothetical protein [Polyangium jinanense]MDC3956129.1 hypothetical protein [Polyangium jinanense]MDC3983036.1 hypothetical protein [Polyangium jinanense]